MTRARTTTPRRRRSRERWGVLGTIALAAVAGLLAASFGSPRAWEHAPAGATTTTSVLFVQPQRNP